VKSKCFRDGVFCGQVFINGEMRMIQKTIPDKSAADGIEIEMPHRLAAKIHENSQGMSPVSKPFDVIDGLVPKSLAGDFPATPQGKSRHGSVMEDSHVPALDSVPYSTNTPMIGQKSVDSNLQILSEINRKKSTDGEMKREKLVLSQSHINMINVGLNTVQMQDTMKDIFFPDMMNPNELAKQILNTCNYVNPSIWNSGEFRFSNTSGGSVASVGSLERSAEIETISKSGVLPKENGSITLPSIAIANRRVAESNDGTVSPLIGTKFPESLLESNQPRVKKKKKSAKRPIRPPIEIPKLRVKVCIVPNESRYKCPDCEYITDTMPMAILHMRESQHGGMKKKTYRCQVCSKKFLLKETLCRHMKTCTGHSKCAKHHSSALSLPVKNDVFLASNGNNVAPLKNGGYTEIRKEPKVEIVDNDTLVAQPKCAIDFNDFNSLATFGDVANSASLKSTRYENNNTNEMPPKKKKKYSNMSEEMTTVKSEPGVYVKSEKVEPSSEQPAKPKGTALPGIGTFFSSNLGAPNMFGVQTPNTLPSFQSFLGGVSAQKTSGGFTPQGIPVNSSSKTTTENGKVDKSLSSLFPWMNIKSVLKSFPDDVNLNRCSESDLTDVIPAIVNDNSILDTSLAGNHINLQTCLQCRATFKTLSLLRYHQHKNSHDGYKPYPCTHCDSNFGSKGHLDTHLRKHTKEKPYFCPLCHRTFSRVDLVNSHLRLQHNMPIHISGKDVLLPKYMWNSEEENNMDINSIHLDEN
jgi:hypothetical protein